MIWSLTVTSFFTPRVVKTAFCLLIGGTCGAIITPLWAAIVTGILIIIACNIYAELENWEMRHRIGLYALANTHHLNPDRLSRILEQHADSIAREVVTLRSIAKEVREVK